jgi:hypothetical protein|tara:strand:- start:207 stop:314 length:108 start_codon:yes stop_codon:yes gene_type:complete
MTGKLMWEEVLVPLTLVEALDEDDWDGTLVELLEL